MQQQQKKVAVWFTQNLRVEDNNVLNSAARTGLPIIGVYFFDPKNFIETPYGFKKTERYRAQFILESLKTLQENLNREQIALQVYVTEPKDGFAAFVKQHNIHEVFVQKEWTSEERNSIDAVKNALDVPVYEIEDQLLYHSDDFFAVEQQIPEVFTQFRKLCEKKLQVRKPKSFSQQSSYQLYSVMQNNLPSIQDLGLNKFVKDSRSAFPFYGGENAALARLEDYIWGTQNIRVYKKTRNRLTGTEYSSKLAPWLAVGAISARKIYAEILRYEKEVLANESTYWLKFELIWRDYFKYIALKHGRRIFSLQGINGNEAYDNFDTDLFQHWINGTTDDDFVNANMKELALTGWMSNRGRQNVASYWAKTLKQDWRIGAAYFESYLIDYDVHSNWCNWMYVSGVGNDPRNRTFNTQLQANRYDADGSFRELWLSPNAAYEEN